MEKPTENTYPVNELIKRRWSPRAFADRPVERGKLYSLFEAARWAASSFNEQPWSFLVATKAESTRYVRLLDCLVEGNREWAKNAPLLMLSVARLDFERNGKPNRHAYHDVGLAMANLIFQATDCGLFAHQMAGFDVDRARESLEIPDGYDPVAMVALGYPGDVGTLPESLEQRERAPRTRKALADFVFSGTWRESFPFES
ncbi:MAG: nitroreductase family protein [Acidobacteriota bacterium]